ncbi:MAG: EF-hand domain-containing protein [Shinella sp.]|nr:EF-hand domain-containing protein [Shinella sp.]
MRKTIIAAFAVTLALSGAAFAQTAPLHEGHFNQLDASKDGKISKAEYRTFMEQAFDQVDTNRDGSLGATETAKALTPAQFSQVDANKDGQVSRKEFLDHVTLEFDQNDKDKDGHLQK